MPKRACRPFFKNGPPSGRRNKPGARRGAAADRKYFQPLKREEKNRPGGPIPAAGRFFPKSWRLHRCDPATPGPFRTGRRGHHIFRDVDEVVFKEGKFISSGRIEWGFSGGEYTTTADGEDSHFVADTYIDNGAGFIGNLRQRVMRNVGDPAQPERSTQPGSKGSTIDEAPHHHHDQGGDEHAGHDEHEGHSPEMFRDRFWLSLILTVPVLFWSMHIQKLLGYQAPEFTGSAWIPAALATAVFLYGGVVFLKGAWRELKARLPGMMTLISDLGTSNHPRVRDFIRYILSHSSSSTRQA